jgi:hypothetical protein
MSSRAQSQFLRIFSTSTTYVRWQSYYVNQTVTLDSNSWEFMPFAVNGITETSAAGGQDLTVEIPATNSVVSEVEAAINNSRFVEIQIYEFNSTGNQSAPQSTQTLIAEFTGQVQGLSGNFTRLELELGSALAPVGAQVPPRKYNSFLIGAPLRK